MIATYMRAKYDMILGHVCAFATGLFVYAEVLVPILLSASLYLFSMLLHYRKHQAEERRAEEIHQEKIRLMRKKTPLDDIYQVIPNERKNKI